jgi:hypothetical protein
LEAPDEAGQVMVVHGVLAE